MANTYFQFKEFIVHQDKAAMKVCTDACLFGAWVANCMLGKLKLSQNVLDIGTGTGLLSLMVAQGINNTIDAVEIDDAAFEQALGNFQISKWKARIRLFRENIQTFQPETYYGLILVNPPFFENDLKASAQAKNLAKHESLFRLDRLFTLSAKWLTTDGFLAILLPAYRKEKALVLSRNYGFILIKETAVKQTNLHSPFRFMLLFSKIPGTISQDEIVIKQDGLYTPAFTDLLKPYYLQL